MRTANVGGGQKGSPQFELNVSFLMIVFEMERYVISEPQFF